MQADLTVRELIRAQTKLVLLFAPQLQQLQGFSALWQVSGWVAHVLSFRAFMNLLGRLGSCKQWQAHYRSVLCCFHSVNHNEHRRAGLSPQPHLLQSLYVTDHCLPLLLPGHSERASGCSHQWQ